MSKKIQKKNVRDSINQSLSINYYAIKAVHLIGGMTNKNYLVETEEGKVVLRLPGCGLCQTIDRVSEKRNCNLVCKIGLDVEIKYLNENTGVKVSKFEENKYNVTSKIKEDDMNLVALTLNKLHNSNIIFKNRFDVMNLAIIYENLLKENGGGNFKDYNIIKGNVSSIIEILKSLNISLKPCHNDPVPENFIINNDREIYLIDWEYSGMNDPLWDVAAFSLECNLSEMQEHYFLNKYLLESFDENHELRILISKVLQDFVWSLWTKVKEAEGEYFGEYGVERWSRLKKNIKKMII